MDNPEKLATLGTQETGQRQTKQQKTKSQKTKAIKKIEQHGPHQKPKSGQLCITVQVSDLHQ